LTIKVLVKKEVSNKLDELPNDLKKRIRTALNELESMWPTCRLDIKKLKWHDNHYRIRVGDYRILFFREDGIAKIYDISHRSEVYK